MNGDERPRADRAVDRRPRTPVAMPPTWLIPPGWPTDRQYRCELTPPVAERRLPQGYIGRHGRPAALRLLAPVGQRDIYFVDSADVRAFARALDDMADLLDAHQADHHPEGLPT